jgi:hypothetical protein
MGQVIENMKGNYCRKNTIHNLLARNDRRRSFIPMVVFGRQEQLPGAFLFLNRYRTGLKPSEELPSNSYYPITVPHIKSRFRFESILSLLTYLHCWKVLIILIVQEDGIIFLCQVVVVIGGTETLALSATSQVKSLISTLLT